MAITVGDICKIILAVILPPLGVFAEKERCDKDVLINILLTILGFIPGRPALAFSLITEREAAFMTYLWCLTPHPPLSCVFVQGSSTPCISFSSTSLPPDS